MGFRSSAQDGSGRGQPQPKAVRPRTARAAPMETSMKCVLRQLSVSSTLLALLVAGCAVLTIDTWRNPKLRPDEPPKPTAARTTISVQDLSHSHGVFIGVAMSGGGSRAANFSAAVLIVILDLGILPYVTAMSSVSGSSL